LRRKPKMRKTLAICFVAALVVAILPLAAGAGEGGEWTGWITDANCGAKGANAEHKACALRCHERGEAFVFYNNADEKLYQLSDQEMAAEHLGHEVTVHGELEDDTITVASMEMSGEMEDDGMDDEGMDEGTEGHGR